MSKWDKEPVTHRHQRHSRSTATCFCYEEVQSDFLTHACPVAIVKPSCIPKFGRNILFPYRGPFFKRRRSSERGCCGSRCKVMPWESRVCSRLSQLQGFPHCTTLLFGCGHGEHLPWRRDVPRTTRQQQMSWSSFSHVRRAFDGALRRHTFHVGTTSSWFWKMACNYPGAKINDCKNTRGLSNMQRTCCFL